MLARKLVGGATKPFGVPGDERQGMSVAGKVGGDGATDTAPSPSDEHEFVQS